MRRKIRNINRPTFFTVRKCLKNGSLQGFCEILKKAIFEAIANSFKKLVASSC